MSLDKVTKCDVSILKALGIITKISDARISLETNIFPKLYGSVYLKCISLTFLCARFGDGWFLLLTLTPAGSNPLKVN